MRTLPIKIERKNTMKMNEVENTPLGKEEQGTLLEPCRLKDIRKVLQWTIGTCKHAD